MLPREAPRPARRRGGAHLPRLRLAAGALTHTTAAPASAPTGTPVGALRRGVARRAGLAVAGGVLLFAGHPPLDIGPAGWVALVPLVLLAEDLATDRHPVRGGLGWGLIAGLVFFVPLLWWMERFGVIALVLLALIQALTVAAYVAGLAAWGGRRGRLVAAVLWWLALEVVRGRWPFGGFSWGALGYSQHGGGPFLDLARVLGVLGVGAACAIVAVCVVAVVGRVRRVGRARDGRGLVAAAGPPLGVLLGLVAVAMLVPGDPPAPTGETIDIAGVQGNEIESSGAAGVARLDSDRIVRVTEQMLDATRPLADDPPELTVWPENAVDADLRDPENSAVRGRVGAALDLLEGGPMLVGGLYRGPREGTRYNVVMVLDGDVEPEAVYLKRAPVPFAEYIPFRRWLEWIPPLQQIPTDVLAAEEPTVLDVAGARVAAAICFENGFPPLLHAQVREGAEVLVVATNNASFGRTPMSRQHLAISRLRAVETGRYVLHAGISGISAVVDPDGVTSQETPLFEAAIVRDDLPLVEGQTVATRIDGWADLVVAVTAVAGSIWLVVDRRRRRSAPAQMASPPAGG